MRYEQAKEHLMRGKTREALNLLREPLQSTDLYDEWMIIRARYETMREKEMKGVLSQQELSLEHNRINNAVLRLLDRAEQKQEVPVERQPEPVPPARPGVWPKWIGWGIAAVVAVVLFFALAWRLNQTSEPSIQTLRERLAEEEPAKAQPPSLKNEAARANPVVLSKYDISKISGNRDLPFEIHTLSKTGEVVMMDMTLANRTGKSVKLGEMQLRHTGDRSTGISNSLSGTTLAPGEKIRETFKFRWAIKGDPKAFRMKMDYAVLGTSGNRELKTDFGIYKKVQ